MPLCYSVLWISKKEEKNLGSICLIKYICIRVFTHFYCLGEVPEW